MKTKNLLFLALISIAFFNSCTSIEPVSPALATAVTSSDVLATQEVDNAIDDVAVVADDYYETSEGSTTGKTDPYPSMLPACVTKSDLGSTPTVRKMTITFGTDTTPCEFRGRKIKGQIIFTRTVGITFPKIMTVSYVNFYINDNKLEGTSTWKREMVGTGADIHPKTTFSMSNMTLITKEGVYYRNGDRIREMIAGFLTRTSPTDDVFLTYGTFTTIHPNGSIFSSSIASATPLINKTACGMSLTNPIPFPVSGILKLTKNALFTTIDYGNGDCDDLAMISVDGAVATQITLKRK